MHLVTLAVAALTAACHTDAERGSAGPVPESPAAPIVGVATATYLTALDGMAAGAVASVVERSSEFSTGLPNL